jgi:hypothetical protein
VLAPSAAHFRAIAASGLVAAALAVPLVAGGDVEGRPLALTALSFVFGATQAFQYAAPLRRRDAFPTPPRDAAVRSAGETFRGDLVSQAGVMLAGAAVLAVVVAIAGADDIDGRSAAAVLLATWGTYNAALALGALAALRRVRAHEGAAGVRLLDDWTGARARLLRAPARTRFYAEPASR